MHFWPAPLLAFFNFTLFAWGFASVESTQFFQASEIFYRAISVTIRSSPGVYRSQGNYFGITIDCVRKRLLHITVYYFIFPSRLFLSSEKKVFTSREIAQGHSCFDWPCRSLCRFFLFPTVIENVDMQGGKWKDTQSLTLIFRKKSRGWKAHFITLQGYGLTLVEIFLLCIKIKNGSRSALIIFNTQ